MKKARLSEVDIVETRIPIRSRLNLRYNVTAKENIPFSCNLLSGSTVDGTTILENMKRLKKLNEADCYSVGG